MGRSGLLESRRQQKAARAGAEDGVQGLEDDPTVEEEPAAPPEHLVVEDPDEWAWEAAARWQCRCGYVNAGFDRCPSCGGRNPDKPAAKQRGERREISALEAWERPGQSSGLRAARPNRVGGKAGRTVVGIILLNIGLSVVTAALAAGSGLQLGDYIRLSLFTGLIFFALTAMWVVARGAILGVRPVVASGRPLAGAAEGAVVGGGLAIVLVAVARIAEGHPVLDPIASFLASEAIGPMLVGVFLLVVAAPIVEELVFRGFLAEALRPRGKRIAGLVSAAAFSIAHLRFAQFRYYVGMGLVLAFLYWRRGLVASVSAHAAFNGMLVVAALAVAHGPALTLSGGGATMTVPGTWQVVDAPKGGDLAAQGPSGAVIEVGSQYVEGFIGSGTELLAQNLASGALPLPPGLYFDPDSVGIMDLPAGRAVSVDADVYGHDGRLVAILKGDRVWIVTITTGGSDRARHDFSEALYTLRLP